MCIIGLTTFYFYRKIEVYDFVIAEAQQTNRESFFQEFGMTNIETDLLVREIVIGTRIELEAAQASI